MRRRHLLALALLALVATVMSSTGPARATDWIDRLVWLNGPRYDSDLPACEAALYEVTNRFAEKERKFWNSNLEIVDFANVRELAIRPWEPGNIPRRFCTAQAKISDGKVRTVNFSLIENGGYASIGDGVEFCVVGLDRNWAYNPACRMARP